MRTEPYEGNDCFFVIESSCVQTTKHNNTGSIMYLFAKGGQSTRKALAQRECILANGRASESRHWIEVSSDCYILYWDAYIESESRPDEFLPLLRWQDDTRTSWGRARIFPKPWDRRQRVRDCRVLSPRMRYSAESLQKTSYLSLKLTLWPRLRGVNK